jgi:aspartate/methionine/tyrosine aminotransferase
VLARAKALEREGREIVHLEIGEPDFDTPEHIRDAAKRTAPPTTGRRPGCPSSARPSPRTWGPRARSRWTPTRSW